MMLNDTKRVYVELDIIISALVSRLLIPMMQGHLTTQEPGAQFHRYLVLFLPPQVTHRTLFICTLAILQNKE